MTTFSPLASIRRKGFDADLHQGCLRVWPRHKMKRADCRFVSFHLLDIVKELTVEANEKAIENYFAWVEPATANTGLSGSELDMAIRPHMNGAAYSAGHRAA